MNTFHNRLGSLTLFALIALASPFLKAEPLIVNSSDGQQRTLEQIANAPANLLLLARDQDEIRNAFPLLTRPADDELSIHLIIATPSNNPIKAKAIQLATQRYITSNFSKKHIHFSNTSDLVRFLDAYKLPSSATSLAINKNGELQWSSNAIPSDADIQAIKNAQ